MQIKRCSPRRKRQHIQVAKKKPQKTKTILWQHFKRLGKKAGNKQKQLNIHSDPKLKQHTHNLYSICHKSKSMLRMPEKGKE